MHRIVAPLSPGMDGREVASLQDALRALLDRGLIARPDEGLRRELADAIANEAGKYSDATTKTVEIFQEERRLDVRRGEVDETTAAALNDLLEELGLLDGGGEAAEVRRQYAVGGVVLTSDGTPPRGVVVRAYHEDDDGAIRLGQDAVDTEGHYTIRYEPLPAADQVNLRVSASTTGGGRLGSSELVAGARPLERIDLTVDLAAGDAVYTVRGTVASPNRAAVAGLDIRIIDRNVGDHVELQRATTDERGRYQTTFDSAALRARGKDRPDIQVRVYANDALLAESDVRYDASSSEVVDVALPPTSDHLATEYDVLTVNLAARFGGALRDLKESDGRQDVTYLANKTGWDARAVAMASLADRFSQYRAEGTADGIAPPLYYALFRAGLPAEPDALFAADNATVERAWDAAMAGGVIGAVDEVTRKKALGAFRNLGIARALDGRALEGASTLKELINPVLSTDAEQRRFAELRGLHRRDPGTFWREAEQAFGKEKTDRLRLDGQLATLTLNNATLIEWLHTKEAETPLATPLDLAKRGYFQADAWGDLTDMPIPSAIPGTSEELRRANYAELLAAQVRVSFPTQSVAELVRSGQLSLSGSGELHEKVHAFLSEHQSEFSIATQPVEQYVVRKGTNGTVEPEVIAQVSRLQRVYQITPNDQAMSVLLKHGLDSSAQIMRYERGEFIATVAAEMDTEVAELTYAKAEQVHTAILNLVTSYVTTRQAPAIGSIEAAVLVDGSGSGLAAESSADIIAMPTLESLLGSMDYCACDHCRSVLSPAAYLVDLLEFIDRPTNAKENPLTVLLERRPDLQHLLLSCENTNTALPYIDVVNEALEYFVAHNLSLANFAGYDTGDQAKSAELLAAPQHGSADAYLTLAATRFPPPLPFDQPLAALRAHFAALETPLAGVLEALRATDALDSPNQAGYGWRDILMERLGLSRAEYRLLTDRTVALVELTGFPAGVTDAQAIVSLTNAKAFSRRAGITYDETAALLSTRFVNPNARLIPRLERLDVPFATLQALKDGTITDAEFLALLPSGLDPAVYDGDIVAWVKNANNFAAIMSIIVLEDTGDGSDPCSFDDFAFTYANPDPNANNVRGIDFVRMIRFIRLWRALGWTMEQTDQAIAALYPVANLAVGPDEAADLQALDAGFLVLLPRLGFALQMIDRLKLRPARDLSGLLACWADIDTHGRSSPYARMFLNPATLQLDAAFADDGYGRFLVDGAEKLLPHTETLRAALGLTGDELTYLVGRLGFDANSILTLANVSALYRRAWLARTLKTSVRELVELSALTGIDPFAAPDLVVPAPASPLDPVLPPILRFVDLMRALRASSLKQAEALYLIWNLDLGGQSAPGDSAIVAFAHTLRSVFDGIEAELAVDDDPTGEITRTKMALVYPAAAADAFFGLLNGSTVATVAYDHPAAELEALILAAGAGRLGYDDFRKQLSFGGVMSPVTRDALKAVAAIPAGFAAAVDSLFAVCAAMAAPLFAGYPELRALHDAFVSSPEPAEARRRALLVSFLPALARRRRQQHALDAIAAELGSEPAFAPAVLQATAVLHASADATKPALDDLTALATHGLTARYFWRNTATGPADATVEAVPVLAFRATGPVTLPANGVAAGDPISAIYSGYLDAPEKGAFGISVEADIGATVSISVGGRDIPLATDGRIRSNTVPVELTAGLPAPIEIRVDSVRTDVIVRWATAGLGWTVIPSRYLFSGVLIERARSVYVRFFKAVSLAAALRLGARELVYLTTQSDEQIGGRGWLNSLPISGLAGGATAVALGRRLAALLAFVDMRQSLSPADERLLDLMQSPAATLDNGDSLLATVTGWSPVSADALLGRFGRSRADLGRVAILSRLYEAFGPVRAIGIEATSLLSATTNAPTAASVTALQTALRARYAETDWLDVLKPINDGLRAKQRDALVAYVLQRFSESDATRHIDTANKLFEYFLMDVQMEPCMETSRVRHALSTVQLFIERCLMNLEPRVAPSSIRAGQWEWMKRYRVWEANRKVFLWPENWLDPELRDDQSQPFKETMSALLQSDITEDAAAEALGGYLMRLEEIAKLEPCGIHVVERDPGVADDIVHVIARTAGAARKHFYRRREGGSWTPWEHVKLDIEDAPITPVVWRDRLFLFWLKITKESRVDPAQLSFASTTTKPVAELSLSEVKGDVNTSAADSTKLRVGAVLCWSERVNGKWTPAKTSDVERPTLLGEGYAPAGSGSFDRSNLQLYSAETDHGLWVWTAGSGYGGFLLYNTHSLPVRYEDVSWDGGEALITSPFQRSMWVSGGNLAGQYNNYDANVFEERDILSMPIGGRLVQSTHPTVDAWVTPFFLEDSRHVFYVTTTSKAVSIAETTWYGADPGWAWGDPKIPEIYYRFEEIPEFKIPDPIGPVIKDRGMRIVNPVEIRKFVSEDAHIRTGIATQSTVQFDGTSFGVAGQVMNHLKGKFR